MSAGERGMATARQAQRLQEVMDPGVVTGKTDTQGVQGGAKAVQFERKFDARSPYDDEMNTKMQLMDKDGMTPFGQVYYDDKVGKWLERKQGALEAADFDSYFNANFNKNDLASRQFAQQLNPEFYEAREREMDERVEVVKALKKMQLRGPQNKQDVYMLWLIETGRVQLPPNWDTIGPGYDAPPADNTARFQKGLIKMPLFLSKDQTAVAAGRNAQPKPLGAGAWGSVAAGSRRAFGLSAYDAGNGNNNPLAQWSGSRSDPNTVSTGFLKFLR